MTEHPPRPARSLLYCLCLPLAAACASSPEVAPRTAPTTATPVTGPAPTEQAPSGLYGAAEALQDVLAGDLQHVGTGKWPAVERSHACVFRNDRVLVVLGHCGIEEPPAFRIDVYSPTRGRMRVYAEAPSPLSQRDRGEYFNFMVESEPPADPALGFGTLSLSMDLDALASYERKRVEAQPPSCYGGQRFEERVGRCFGALEPQHGAWAADNAEFMESASDDWYRVVKLLRALAERHGHAPD